MKYVFFAWAIPMGLFWGWYFVSYYDLGAGYLMLSRPGNDLVFNIYGQVLGMDPDAIPRLVARACVTDTFLIAGIWAFRRRREIRNWWRARRQGPSIAVRSAADPAPPAG